MAADITNSAQHWLEAAITQGTVLPPVAGVAQAAVATTAPTNSTPYGFSQAQATAIITLVNALRTALINTGIITGAA